MYESLANFVPIFYFVSFTPKTMLVCIIFEIDLLLWHEHFAVTVTFTVRFFETKYRDAPF